MSEDRMSRRDILSSGSSSSSHSRSRSRRARSQSPADSGSSFDAVFQHGQGDPRFSSASKISSDEEFVTSINSKSTDSGIGRRLSEEECLRIPYNISAISDLDPDTSSFTILGRIMAKTDLVSRSGHNWKGVLFNFTIRDVSGDIRVVAFDDVARAFAPLVAEGKVFYLSDGNIQHIREASKRFNYTSHQFEMSLSNSSRLEECTKSERFPKIKFGLTDLKDIAGIPCNDVINVIGFVRKVSYFNENTNSSGRLYQRRNLFLEDCQGVEVGCTLWGDSAKNFKGFNKAVMIIGCRVSEYMSKKQLSGGYVEVNPDIPESGILQAKLQSSASSSSVRGAGSGGSYLANSSSTSSGSSATSLDASGNMQLKEIKQELKVLPVAGTGYYYSSVIFFLDIERTKMSYKGCTTENCRMKLNEDNLGGLNCAKCGIVEDFVYRFMVTATVCDQSDNLKVSFFEDVGVELFDRTASELMALRSQDEDLFTKVVDAVCFGKWQVTLRYKLSLVKERRCGFATVTRARKAFRDVSCNRVAIQKEIDRLQNILKE